MNTQKLLSYTRQAIKDYDMINDGDKIAIGISGGKDSLTLLFALAKLKQFLPQDFNIEAITVDLGFGIQDFSLINKMCESLNVNYTVVTTNISKIVFNKNESNPCSLCAKMRKGALNDMAKKLNCNKVAYAHHKDDIIETMLLSLLYEGRFYSFSPVTFLKKTKLTVIRPLMYINEYEIIKYAKDGQFPIAKNPCPADGYTKREYVKNLLRELNRENHGCKDRMFHAILNGNIDGWPDINQ